MNTATRRGQHRSVMPSWVEIPAIVELLIARGATIKPHSERFLDYAIAYDWVEIAELLLENGADPSKAPRILDDNSEMSEMLLKAHGVPPKDINAQSHMGWPPLVYACRGDNGEHPEEIQRLLELRCRYRRSELQGENRAALRSEGGFSESHPSAHRKRCDC